MVFQLNSWNVQWAIMALQTITPNHRDLQQITIWLSYSLTTNVGANFRRAIGEVYCGQWVDLDHLLIQLWESCLIRPKVIVATRGADCVRHLLQEVTKRGIIDLVEC